MEMTLSDEVLMGAAAVAISLIGFSGVVTALGRKVSDTWTRAESMQLFALVAPSIVTLFSAFAPIGLALILDAPETIWRVANGICFFGHLCGVSYFLTLGSGDQVRFSQKIGLVCTFTVMGLMLVSALGLSAMVELTFLLGLLLGIGISVHNFYLLLMPAIELGKN